MKIAKLKIENSPQVVLHIDGDSFFASCEISLNPRLQGMPVVTGQERGIATAMSKEAKALGISRGMPIFKIKKLFPQVVIRHSDYTTYEIFSQRMFNIVRRYAEVVEEYSIDECFAEITPPTPSYSKRGQGGVRDEINELVIKIKHDLQSELGMTFSLGVAPTKVLAKVASKWQKPDGLTVIYPENISKFLEETQIGAVWGIGPATARELERHDIHTAADLIDRAGEWVAENLSKPYVAIWHELRGTPVYKIEDGAGEKQKSIQATRTFTPVSTDKNFILAELSKNTENASVKARRGGLAARHTYYFLKTQEFTYQRFQIPLEVPLSTPSEIFKLIQSTFDSVWRPHLPYRATGVTLANLVPEEALQNDLFGSQRLQADWNDVYKTLDRLDKRYGSHSVVLGSSLQAFKKRGDTGFHKRLRIPYLGEVS